MTTGDAALAGGGLFAGVAVAAAVTSLLHRTLQPVAEIDRYADDVRITIDGISAHLRGAGELGRTRDVTDRLAEHIAGETRR